MKEEIKKLLEDIPSIYLEDIFDALNEICVERGVPYPYDYYSEKLCDDE